MTLNQIENKLLYIFELQANLKQQVLALAKDIDNGDTPGQHDMVSLVDNASYTHKHVTLLLKDVKNSIDRPPQKTYGKLPPWQTGRRSH